MCVNWIKITWNAFLYKAIFLTKFLNILFSSNYCVIRLHSSNIDIILNRLFVTEYHDANGVLIKRKIN